MKYKAVLFDFDYTLGDATDAIVAGFVHGMTQMGHPAPQREAVRHTVGMLLEDAFTHLTGDGTAEGRAHFRDLFSQVARPMQQEGVPLFPGARDLILALHQRGILVGMVSTKHTPTLTMILEGHGLDGYFALVVGGDLVGRSKPDPEGLNMAVAQLGLAKADVLYCGDTVIDAQTAQAAGTDFCAVLNGTTPAADFAPYPNVHIAPDLIALHRWLNLA